MIASFKHGGVALLRRRLALFCLCSVSCFSAHRVEGQAIPEPSIVLYGTIRSGAARLTTGTVTWRIQSSTRLLMFSTSVSNINDQFSFALFVPCETEIAGLVASSNVVRLAAAPTTYDISQVTLTYNGTNYPLSFVDQSQGTKLWTSRDRGRLERIDFNAAVPNSDSNGNGITDDWEHHHFNGLVGAAEDPDGDGMNNLAEFTAGTDPNDPLSRFVINITPAINGVRVEWNSTPDASYTLLRSGSLFEGFTNLATGLSATSPTNSFTDFPQSSAPSFYRVRIEN